MSAFLGGSQVWFDVPCLPELITDTLSFVFMTEDEILRAEHPGFNILTSSEMASKEVEDETVTLYALPAIRGSQHWQASVDGSNWVDVSSSMNEGVIKRNLLSVSSEELHLSPKVAALYRNVISEAGCGPVYTDTIRVMPFGKLLCDTLLNAVSKQVIVKVDSAEVIIPKGFHAEDFRLTIMKSDRIPEKPDSVKRMGTVYEFLTSVGDIFDKPLTIRLKNTTGITERNRPNIIPVYFNDSTGSWIPFDNVAVSVDSQYVEFHTRHFTKMTWFESGFGEYLYMLVNEDEDTRIRVFGKDPNQPMNLVYEKYIKANHPEHWAEVNAITRLGNAPFLIKDVSCFTQQVIHKFLDEGVLVKATDKKFGFDVYVDQVSSSFFGLLGGGSWNGQIDNLGYTLGYIYLNSIYADSKDSVMQTIAHEIAHYAMDENMVTSIDNVFWSEAMAPVAGAYVWSDPKVMKVNEPELLLSKNISKFPGDQTIFEQLAQPWDALERIMVLEKFLVNSKDANLSSTFLHYLCHLRPYKLLDYGQLIKNHTNSSALFNWTWRAYLNSQIQLQLGDETSIGHEYDAYVRYLLNTENNRFTLLNKEKGNILSTILASISSENTKDPAAFARYLHYNIKNDLPQKDKLKLKIPYLSSKVQLLYNLSANNVLIVRYKRELEDAHPDDKVYYCNWDAEKGIMNFTDISEKENYSILLKARDEKALDDFSNMGFLLFVNRRCPLAGIPDMLTNFNVDIDLTAYPLLPFRDLVFGFVSGTNAHQYSDGTKREVVFSGRMDKLVKSNNRMSIALVNHNSDLLIEEDTVLVMKTTFETLLTYDNGFPFGKTLQKQETSQEMRYSVLEGEMEFTQRVLITNITGGWYDYDTKTEYPEYVNNKQWLTQSIQLKNVFELEPSNLKPIPGEIMIFKTYDSSETLEAIVRLSDEYKSTSYSMDGKVTDEKSYEYQDTDYSGDVTVELWFSYKK